MTSPDHRPGPERAAVAAVLACLGMLAVSLALAGLPVEGLRLGAGLVAQGLVWALVAGHAGRSAREGPRAALGLGRGRARWLALAALPAGLLVDALARGAQARWPALGGGTLDALALGAAAPGLEGALVLVGAVVFAPLGEELLFRGAIWGGLAPGLGAGRATLVSALLFGAFHLDPLHSPAAFAMGLLLGWMRGATGSLAAPLAAHALNNLLWALSLRPGGMVEPGWEGLLAAALALAAFVGAGRRIEHNVYP